MKKILAWAIAIPIIVFTAPVWLLLGAIYVVLSTCAWALDVASGEDFAKWGL